MFRTVTAALLLPVAIFLAGAALAQASFEERFAEGQPPAVLAHRSAVMGGFPENTLGWIGSAIERGVDVIHINPQRTADDRYVLMHDNTLNRTTNVEAVYPEGPPGGPTRAARGGRDYVGDYTLEEIRALRVTGAEDGSLHPVPTLDEALDLADGRILVMIGLKSYEVDSLARVLNGRDTRNLMLFELYYPGTDQSKLRDLAGATGIGVSITVYGSNDYLAGLEGIHAQLGPALRAFWVRSTDLSPDLRARLAELGLVLFFGGWAGPEDRALVEQGDPEPWRAVLDAGFSAATDQPDLVLQILGR